MKIKVTNKKLACYGNVYEAKLETNSNGSFYTIDEVYLEVLSIGEIYLFDLFGDWEVEVID